MKRGIVEETSPEGGCMMEEKDLSRRDVLRGAMAVGFGLLVPGMFSGCNSKEGASPTSTPASPVPASPAPTSPAPANSPATSAGSAATTTAKKVSQASVQYQDQPKGEQKCDTCMHFIAESNTCKLVDGQISPDGWCILWAKKT